MSHKRSGLPDYKREFRRKETVYECPRPAPVELLCSVCHTAEQEGANLWSCLPYISYSGFFGPTLCDVIIHVINLLPVSLVSCLGIAHEKVHRATPQEINSNPVKQKEECNKVCKSQRDSGKGDDLDEPVGTRDSLSRWMHEEYDTLTRQLRDFTRLTREDDQDLQRARKYVLDCLAEMLTKRDEIEYRMKKKRCVPKRES